MYKDTIQYLKKKYKNTSVWYIHRPTSGRIYGLWWNQILPWFYWSVGDFPPPLRNMTAIWQRQRSSGDGVKWDSVFQIRDVGVSIESKYLYPVSFDVYWKRLHEMAFYILHVNKHLRYYLWFNWVYKRIYSYSF